MGEHITDMMKLNKVAANTPGTGGAGTASTFQNAYSAVEFPLWKVAIGPSDNAVFTVPNGYCYANACFDDFAKVGTQSTFKGTEKLGELVSGPNMAVIDATPTACGRANVACGAAPASWNGGPAVMNKAGLHCHHMHCCWGPKHYWGHSCGLSSRSPAVLLGSFQDESFSSYSG